jgi:hypothetical protein
MSADVLHLHDHLWRRLNQCGKHWLDCEYRCNVCELVWSLATVSCRQRPAEESDWGLFVQAV